MTSVPAPLFPVDPSTVRTPQDLRNLTASQLHAFRAAHPEAFARLASGAPLDYGTVRTPEDARRLTASQLRDFAQAAPERFAQLTALHD